MTEADVNFILSSITKLEHAINTTAKETQGQITTLISEVAVLKNTTYKIEKEVLGNGKEGLVTRMTKAESRLTNVEACQDVSATDNKVLDAKLRKMESVMLKWTGIITGINLTIGAIVTWAVNWEKIKTLFH